MVTATTSASGLVQVIGASLKRRQKGLGFFTQSGNHFPDDALYNAGTVPNREFALKRLSKWL